MITKLLLLVAIPLYYPLQLIGFIAGFLVAPVYHGYLAGFGFVLSKVREQWLAEVTDTVRKEYDKFLDGADEEFTDAP